jgi:hypothetical protein
MRIGKSIWHSRRLNNFNAEIAEYDAPQEIKTQFNYLTVVPASSRGLMEVIKSGETLYDTWTCTANGKYFEGKFKVGDLMWVDGESPNEELEKEYGNGSTANAVIKSALEVNFTISLVLTRNQEQVKR